MTDDQWEHDQSAPMRWDPPATVPEGWTDPGLPVPGRPALPLLWRAVEAFDCGRVAVGTTLRLVAVHEQAFVEFGGFRTMGWMFVDDGARRGSRYLARGSTDLGMDEQPPRSGEEMLRLLYPRHLEPLPG